MTTCCWPPCGCRWRWVGKLAILIQDIKLLSTFERVEVGCRLERKTFFFWFSLSLLATLWANRLPFLPFRLFLNSSKMVNWVIIRVKTPTKWRAKSLFGKGKSSISASTWRSHSKLLFKGSRFSYNSLVFLLLLIFWISFFWRISWLFGLGSGLLRCLETSFRDITTRE